ncbi:MULTISPECIES: MarR family winged helix-turn-helix transcriptional regulator [Lysinibacillus]|uniref:MarR family winged helix-turn-helix transcriptional regulator n=1 Tax=Lysinibacillus TaxID=400634 RepID=UPI00214CA921|nr:MULTISPECIES: MarR family transcriptional regulator [Lysinibacillus]UNT55880.1 MarR family transcriptional regulator [Lysinibacillus capsici]UUV24308.1 MarR family transcriptional regulator [Lysinibacillus sp. FN11]UYB47181.1 MarR family transcriptional regulator [Lysinibacillus capsici]
MKNNQVAEQINQTIEDIWIMLEKMERAYTNFSLNNQQYVLLTLVMRHPSCSPSELADKMAITKSAVSQQLTKLEQDGFIVKRQQEEDKRAFSVELGEKGLLYRQKVDAFNQQITEKYQANLTTEELAEMLATLEKMKKILYEF